MTRRILTWAAVAGALIIVAAVTSGAWQFADDLRAELLVPPSLPPGPEVEVVAVAPDRVTLLRTPDALVPGTWGIATASSYGRIGIVTDNGPTTVTRTYERAEGDLLPGSAQLDQIGYRGDPLQALDRRFEDVDINTELGPAPAWLIGADFETWVIYVHGSGGRGEAMRVAPELLQSGFATLIISYRNDPGAPEAEDGLVTWGFDEWRDVESAVVFALGRGAQNVYLMGSGLGGSAVLMTLSHTTHIRSIRGVILESPVLDLASVEELRRPDAGIIGTLGRDLASWRFGVEWSRLDHLARVAELRRPVLLLHGIADEVTPIGLAEAFARGSDFVEFHPFGAAGHGQVPAISPRQVDRLINDFLIEHLPTPE